MAEGKEKTKKNRSGKTIALDIIIAVLIGVIAFSAWQIGKTFYRYHVGTEGYDEAANIAHPDTDVVESIDWDALKAKNEEIQAWLYQKGTGIDFAIMQTDDNSYYLTHMFNKKYSVKGTPFIDYRDTDPFNEFLTIIYGHRMKDHTVFWSLANYRKDQEYYKKHPTMDLFTPEGDYTLQIFAAMAVPSDSSCYRVDIDTTEEKQEYLNWIEENTTLTTDVQVTTDDRIVMLSTCVREEDANYGGDARALVFAKLVPKKESGKAGTLGSTEASS